MNMQGAKYTQKALDSGYKCLIYFARISEFEMAVLFGQTFKILPLFWEFNSLLAS